MPELGNKPQSTHSIYLKALILNDIYIVSSDLKTDWPAKESGVLDSCPASVTNSLCDLGLVCNGVNIGSMEGMCLPSLDRGS